VVSAAIGSTKANRGIFEHALSLAHVEPTECIFIDNSAWNLVVPREMGMVGKHFDDVTHDVPALIGELAELGVVLDDAT